MTKATFNPLDIGSNVTLSNGNLTAASSTSALTGVRAQDVKGAGKYYFEITADVITSSFDSVVALARPGTELNALTTTHNGAIVVSKSGLVIVPGNDSSTSIGALANGDIVCCAIDFDNKKAYFRKNGGNWNGSPLVNPATNSNGSPIGFVSVAGLQPAVGFGASGDQFTANFGQSSFAFTAPSGFTSGWDTGTTWNPIDKTADSTLSSANLTTHSSASGANGVRATDIHTAGKYYFEVTADVLANATGSAIGIATPGATLAGIGNAAAGGLMKLKSGAIWLNGASNIGTATAISAGKVVGVAVDLDNNTAWFRVDNGIWNNNASADPATNVGGIDISSITSGGVYPCAATGTLNDQWSANFGATPFAQTKPSGFSAWTGATGHAALTAANTTRLSLNSMAAGVGNFTLSGGDLIATHPANTTATGISAFDAQTKGKFYFEGFANVNSQGSTAIGIVTDGGKLFKGSVGQFSINVNSGQITNAAGTVILTNPSQPAAGTALCVAVDLDAKLIWFRLGNGKWNVSATADPASGVGGIDISAYAGAWRPFVCSAASGAVWTVNFGASAFLQVPPAGFTPGWLVNPDILQPDQIAASGLGTTLSVSTEGPDRIIVLSAWFNTGDSVASLSDDAGLTWHARQAHTFANGQNMQTFWAHAPLQLTGNVITATLALNNGQHVLSAIAFKNADLVAPFDPNASVPAYNETASSVSSLSVTGITSDDLVAYAIMDNGLFTTTQHPTILAPMSQFTDQTSGTSLDIAVGTQKTESGFSSATFTGNRGSTGPMNIALDVIRKSAGEIPSSLEGFSALAEQASSDALVAEHASSDHLVAEAASSEAALEHASDERASSDAALERASDERASSDHLAAEEASSDIHQTELPSSEEISSDHLAAEEASSDRGPAEQASSEFQSDQTAEIAPPIQVVAIVS